MKRLTTLLLTAVTLIFSCKNNVPESEPEVVRLPNRYGFFDEGLTVLHDTVRFGDSFGAMMAEYGIDGPTTAKLLELGRGLFDVRKFRAGNAIELYVRQDSCQTPAYVIYRQNRITSTVFSCCDSLAVWNYDRPVEHQRKISDITIHTSLWNDMIAAGADPALIMNLNDIFQWSVNFFTMQEGDRFRAIYSQSVCENEVLAIDTVYFCLYSNAEGKEIGAMRYDIGGKYGKYWGKNGEGMKKMFLKAPLKYNRISSRFSYRRRHPVTGKVRPHTAVDYAAPKGTPVYALGDGKITQCGWDGSGGGNRIRIKHAQGYETCYMHLWKFASGIRAGRSVSQGELIGYVGSTGRSTGPHLDFRVWKNGTPVIPLTLESPSAEPIKQANKAALDSLFTHYCTEFGIDRQ